MMNGISKVLPLLLLGIFCLVTLPTKARNNGKNFTQKECEAANVAVNELTLSDLEKEVYYYLNLARIAPMTFAELYVKDYKGEGYAFDERKESLYQQLLKMKPVGRVKPDQKLIETAVCFATQAGKRGIVGHSRRGTSCKSSFNGECCSYGDWNALAHVVELLIDAGENNEELGHRKIMLDPAYHTMGCAEREHRGYRKNLVMDFGIGVNDDDDLLLDDDGAPEDDLLKQADVRSDKRNSCEKLADEIEENMRKIGEGCEDIDAEADAEIDADL